MASSTLDGALVPSHLHSQYLRQQQQHNGHFIAQHVSLNVATDNEGTTDPYSLEMEHRKTVVLVVWYEVKTAPVRLQVVVPTFPMLQLSRLNNTSLLSDLEITPSTYLDNYNPAARQWDQHTIHSVRFVETMERVLYRVRRSLVDGMSDAECYGLAEELELQHARHKASNGSSHAVNGVLTDGSSSSGSPNPNISPTPNGNPTPRQNMANKQQQPRPSPVLSSAMASTSSSNPRKRPAEPLPPSLSQVQHRRPPPPSIPAQTITPPTPNMYPLTPPTPIPPPANRSQTLPALSSQVHQQPQPPPPIRSASSNNDFSAVSAPTPTNVSRILPGGLVVHAHPHPPLKRWPNDYTVTQLGHGFAAMDRLCALSPSGNPTPSSSPGTTGAGGGMTQKEAFERVFGTRYVKSTVCRHRGLWKRAPREIREEFERYEDGDERAFWGEFVRRLEGRSSAIRDWRNTQPVLGPPPPLPPIAGQVGDVMASLH